MKYAVKSLLLSSLVIASVSWASDGARQEGNSLVQGPQLLTPPASQDLRMSLDLTPKDVEVKKSECSCCCCNDCCCCCWGCCKSIPIIATKRMSSAEVKGLRNLRASDMGRYNDTIHAAKARGMQCVANCSWFAKLMYCVTCCCCCYPCCNAEGKKAFEPEPRKILTPRSVRHDLSPQNKHKRTSAISISPTKTDTLQPPAQAQPDDSPPLPRIVIMEAGSKRKILARLSNAPQLVSPTELSGLASLQKPFMSDGPLSPDSGARS